MTKTISSAAIGVALLIAGFAAAPAQAQSNRTWVSGLGADTGACPITAPCLTFAYAYAQTSVPGEIDVLDPGNFGPVTITSALSIVNDGGGVAAVGVASGNAITIAAGVSDNIHLRGLTLSGVGGGANGIQFLSAASLAIENCVVRNFAGAGINISSGIPGSFAVSNTIASNNNVGIFIQPTGAALVTGVLSRDTTDANATNGIVLSGAMSTAASLNVSIVDSEASDNANYGVVAYSAASHAVTAGMLRSVVASYNSMGIVAQTNSILRVGHSVVTGNGAGVSATGGVIDSYADNDIDGNTTDGTASLATIPMH